MTMIDGVNGAKNTGATTAAEQTNNISTAENESKKLNQALQDELTGAARKDVDKMDTLTPNEKDQLIKYYQDCGYSKQEAEELFNSKADKLETMSRKEAKAWLKEYMEQTGCSKKEAKKAFEEKFGYSVPLSKMQKFLRFAAVVITPVGVVAAAADGATDGKLGIKKFVTGQGNNDAAYVKKEV